MPVLTLDSVSLAFGHLPLLDAASLQVDAGERVALIGRNGSGKSSLLKIVSGELAPDAGAVWRAPGVRIARLDQDVPLVGGRSVFDEVADGLGDLAALVTDYHHAATRVAETAGDPPAHAKALERLGALQHALDERDGWRLEQKVELVISRLGLPADRPVGELSGGWRRRALLGRALVAQPDVLLLDEPTNHLDIDAIQWLEEYLADFPGALLFVTHDRAFLTTLATRIVELDRGRLTSWPGSYPRYLETKAEALETEARDLARLDKKLAQEEAWLRQGVKARRTRNEGRVKALVELRARRAAHREEGGTVRLALDAGEATGKLVFEAKGISKRFDGVEVIRDFSARILRGDRIGLIGPNGAGKSTLLRLLLGEIEPDAGTVRHGSRLQVAYFDQQREQLDPDATVADSVNDGNTTIVMNGQPRHIIGYLADFLFPRERALSPVKSLSGGERNRLMLARLFAKPANVLVLDEPTNDLDIETLELLEELIADFDGTVLLVSHDRVFLDHIVTSTFAFEGEGRVVEYVGGWEDYLRQRRLPTPQLPTPQVPGPKAATPGHASVEAGFSRPVRKLSYNEQRELETLPDRIAALEEEQERLRRESESPEFYKAPAEHIKGVLARLEAIGPELEAAIARWMELEDRR
ncbi:MAG TPA: ATP-binding cassette domain-containing protein [Vicinamibacterales bacterium]|nr:ATP-binding cassette domain-containing protein [Vicinamibacterales bacterium]